MKDTTKLTQLGRNSIKHDGAVNPPIYQTSTILFPTLEDYHAAENGTPFYESTRDSSSLDHGYGINGTATTFALQQAIATLEEASSCVITPSGLSAISCALLSITKAGDHILIADSVYGPTRRFCNKMLKSYGIETTYYDPQIGSDIETLIQENTRVIYLESPGSLTFEMQDIPALISCAKSHNILTIFDNSWATPLYFKPLAAGINISIEALTKYVGGHSDIILGSISSNDATINQQIQQGYRTLGLTCSPYDCSLALRGLRTMAARLEQQQRSTQTILDWLEQQSWVKDILYPAHPKDPGYAIWKEHFSGATSLFSLVLDKRYETPTLARCINSLQHFGIGCSWGGYESLITDFDPLAARSTKSSKARWKDNPTCIRLYIGLEDPQDLISDLEQAFSKLAF